MSELNLILLMLGGLTLALSYGATLLQSQRYLPAEMMIAVAFGIIIGPLGLDLLRPSEWGSPLLLIEEIARLTVALAVTSLALQLPEDYFRRRAVSMAVLLGPGFLLMWLLSALVTGWVFSLPLWMAMLVGAIVTPTDPVLASTLVVGQTAEENIPIRLRHLLSGEAGANDGGAYLFVSLALFMLGYSEREGVFEWATYTLFWEILGAVVLGGIIGWVLGRLEAWLSEKELLEEASVHTITVALTFATLGFVELLGTNDILAVFVAGATYNWQSNPRDEGQEAKVEEVFNRLFSYPIFVVFGMILPWTEWVALGWSGVALVVGILLFRRLPMILAFSPAIRPLNRTAAAWFVGWFGPIGVAALYYAAHAAQKTGSETPWILGSLVVFGSIVAHGSTTTHFTLEYGQLQDEAEWW